MVSSKYFLQLNTFPFLKKVLTNAVFFCVLLLWRYFSTCSCLASWAAAVNPAQMLRKEDRVVQSPLPVWHQWPIKNFFSGLAYIHLTKKSVLCFSYQDVAVKCVAEWGLCSVLYLQMTGKWWWPRATSGLLLSELAKTARCLGHLSGPPVPSFPGQGYECFAMLVLGRLSAQTSCLLPSRGCAQEGKCVDDNQRWVLQECPSSHLTLSLRWKLTDAGAGVHSQGNGQLVVAKGQEHRVGGRWVQLSKYWGVSLCWVPCRCCGNTVGVTWSLSLRRRYLYLLSHLSPSHS